ncbi:dienelactone hydrolase family protein [Marimonas lutisalis]|uniref:dienelactone hydrolase family protein n=1 Tax=Marimonas lutisalis TaxID=2545756 RepID=UPI0010F4EFBE|nr:dienelactone hydrolase family protein [Marimonas lutisalis]
MHILRDIRKAPHTLFTWLRAAVPAALLAATVLAQAPAAQAATQVSIPSGAKSSLALNGRLHRPSGSGRAPAVILMHGCGGWQPPVLAALEDYARFLSSNGMVVLNLDSFGPRGNSGGRVCNSYQRLAAARDYRTQDAYDALNYLKSQPFVDPDNVFLIGQSNGGSVGLIAAKASTERRYAPGRAGFRGVVALYPWCGAAGSVSLNLAAPLLVLGGERDDWVPPRDCKRFSSRGASVHVKTYSGAAHSFDLRIPVQRYLGKLVGFNQPAATQARREILSFIKTHATRRF